MDATIPPEFPAKPKIEFSIIRTLPVSLLPRLTGTEDQAHGHGFSVMVSKGVSGPDDGGGNARRDSSEQDET